TKTFRDLDDCDEIYRLSKITDEKTCFVPVAVCIAYAIQSKKLEVIDKDRPVVEITMAKNS
ncbi:MAG: hypothetical protein QXI31_00555, partial [Archaeoglobaceae archaeon]